MVRADTLALARRLDRPETAYVVRFPGLDGTVDAELTWAELARETAWVAAQLRGLGLAAGQRVLLTGSGAEGPWLRPLMDALRSLCVTYGIAEGMGWDSNRTVVFTRELDLHAVIGLSEPTVSRLGGSERLHEMFAATPVVLARPEAVPLLRQAGVTAGTVCFVGPTLAIECGRRQGAHVNGTEWRLGDRDGVLWMAGTGPRAGRLGETPLAIRGRVTTETCGCGSQDPRIILS
jgi:hypothetical protein